MNPEPISIRPANDGDIEALTRLVGELGYEATARGTEARLARVVGTPGNRILVAVTEEKEVVGWVHVFGAPRLESDGFAELGGLVVAEERRGHGIGSRLIEAAEGWSRRQGFGTLRIRSRVERNASHRFFENFGFLPVKTQRVYERLLRESESKNSEE